MLYVAGTGDRSTQHTSKLLQWARAFRATCLVLQPPESASRFPGPVQCDLAFYELWQHFNSCSHIGTSQHLDTMCHICAQTWLYFLPFLLPLLRFLAVTPESVKPLILAFKSSPWLFHWSFFSALIESGALIVPWQWGLSAHLGSQSGLLLLTCLSFPGL